MADHFGCIGVPVASVDELVAVAGRAAETAEGVSVGRATYYRYTDPSGAELWVQADAREQFLGINPHFVGRGVLDVGLVGAMHRRQEGVMDGAFHGWVKPDEGGDSGLHPILFDSPCALTHADLTFPHRATVQVAAFPHHAQLFPSRELYDSGAIDAPGFAAQSFVPAGLFDASEEPEAVAVMTGVITEVELRTNRLTGAQFWWLLVESLGGTLDVVAAQDDFPSAPVEGGVIYGTFWLSGRLLPTEA